MIKYHPSDAVLEAFVTGELPASVSLVTSSHIEMCQRCQQRVEQLTEAAALKAFDLEEAFNENEFIAPFDADSVFSNDDENLSPESQVDSRLLDNIMALPAEDLSVELDKEAGFFEYAGDKVSVPRALRSIPLQSWQGVGKVSRARFNFDDEDLRMSLLHIDKGGLVPQHTHKGFEITLLLQGSFEDEMGHYVAGDFIWLDGKHTHEPVTKEGCTCLTVSSDALRFTQGVSQLLNPIGKLIY